MAKRFHLSLAATTFLATIAVVGATASALSQSPADSGKSDRLPVASAEQSFLTIESRLDGVSILTRVAAETP